MVSNPDPKKDITHPNQPRDFTSSDDDVIEINSDEDLQSLSPFDEEEVDLSGVVLGNYRLIEPIGEGASAVVYRAEHVKLGVPYAVKILHPAILSRKGMVERFLREAKAAGQLRHENVVFIADFAIHPKIGPYMVMEYLEGSSLQTVIEKEGALPLKRVREIARQTCQALALAHDAGIIHRDFKPDNVFLVPRKNREVAKILDFGIARLAQGGASLTGVGNIIGTPLYMSPEQCRGAELTKASDIYSFGIVLYQMLVGTTPFVGDNPQKLIVDHFLVPPPKLGPEFPESLRKLQDDLLAKDPKDRPQSMEEVWERLSAALDEALVQQSDTSDQLPSVVVAANSTSDSGAHASSSKEDIYVSLSSSSTRQTGTWSEEFSPTQQWDDASQEAYKRESSFSDLSIQPQQIDPNRQTLDFASPAFSKQTIQPSQDPSQQTMQTPAIPPPPSVVVQQKRQRPIVVQQKRTPPSKENNDPLLQDLEQIFAPESSTSDATSFQDSSTTGTDTDEELLKDLHLLTPPVKSNWKEQSSSDPLWSSSKSSKNFSVPSSRDEEPTNPGALPPTPEQPNSKGFVNSPQNYSQPSTNTGNFQSPSTTGNFQSPSTTGSFQPPSTTGNFSLPTPQNPSQSGFMQASSFSASNNPQASNPYSPKNSPADSQDFSQHTELDMAGIDPSLEYTSEDVELSQRLREIEKQQQALKSTLVDNDYLPPPSTPSSFDEEHFGQENKTEIDLSLYPENSSKRSLGSLLLVILFVILALGSGLLLLVWLFPSLIPIPWPWESQIGKPPSLATEPSSQNSKELLPLNGNKNDTSMDSNPFRVCIRVTSRPKRASIYIGGIRYGVTPKRICRHKGTRLSITLRKYGYKAFHRRILFHTKNELFFFPLKRR